MKADIGRRRILLSLFTAAGVALSGSSFAQGAYPSKPVRLIAPFSPGGTLDLVARGIANSLSEQLGQTFVVENRAGAAGAIGSEYVARAAPDGYTLLLGATTTHGVNPALNPNLPYDPVKDFVPVSLLATIPHVLVVNPSVPANNLAEFIAYAKAKPGLAFGSAGNGSPHHLAGELLKSSASIDATHVPYKGAGPALNDVMAGQLAFMSIEITAAAPQIKSGKIRPIAIASSKRAPGADVPTFVEAGLPGFEVTAWYAIFAPAGTPKAIVDLLAAECAKALSKGELRERIISVGGVPVGSTSAELDAHVKAELQNGAG